MENRKFRAMLISEIDNNMYQRQLVTKTIEDLPEGDILIKVHYSSLNYKDALSCIGNKGVTKKYPHIPGIDAAGLVVASNDETIQVNDPVIVMGHDFGMSTWGGFAEYIRVPKEWVVPLPKGLSLKDSMIYGTAGFTAALSIYKMIHGGVRTDAGEVLVTGASGGVGSIAVSLLSKIGFDVIAASGKPEAQKMLKAIGAKDTIDRKDLNDESGKPMLSGRWAGVIDTVGGNMLATALKSTQYGACVTCCGNVASHELPTSVYPFILRGVTLFGIDAVQCPRELRFNIWEKLATDWKLDSLDYHVNEITLDDLSEKVDLILKGKLKGRTIISYV